MSQLRDRRYVRRTAQKSAKSSRIRSSAIVVLTKFMNAVMYDGKKSAAERIVYGALDHRRRAGASRIRCEMFHQALDNVHAGRRSALPPRRRRHLSGAGRSAPRAPPGAGHPLADRGGPRRNENTMIERLSGELLDAANNRGTAVKKREDTHRMAEANRAFSHYRW